MSSRRVRARRPSPITDEQVDDLLARPSLEDDGEALAELFDERAAEAEALGQSELSTSAVRLAAQVLRSLTSKVRALG